MRIVSLLASVAVSFVVVSSCDKKDPSGKDTKPITYTLEGPLELELSQSGGSRQYAIVTEASWQVIRRSAQTWAEVRPVSGSGNGTFMITAYENTTGQQRTMKFSIYLNGEEQTDAITLTQKAAQTVWDETGQDSNMVSSPHMGVQAFDACEVQYRRGGKAVLNISLSAPVVVGVADREESWGFFQFPGIGVEGNTIRVAWQMNNDSEVIGSSGRPSGKMYSTDGGETWRTTGTDPWSGGLELANGDLLADNTQKSRDITQYDMPAPIGTDNTANEGKYTFYEWDSVPEDFQGWYLRRGIKSSRTWNYFKAPVYDPGACIHAVGKWMTVALYGGNMIRLPDGSILSGQDYINRRSGDTVLDAGTTFYHSTNEGQSWSFRSEIPFYTDLVKDPNAAGRRTFPFGYSEPCTVLLANGNLLHVVRTGGPLYRNLSTDDGRTWSQGVPFTPNGVKPRLLQLANGVLVLSTGRPGVQVRFSFDGNGEIWTDPFEMISFPSSAGNYDTSLTCGYAPIVACGNNSFYIAYSDFKYQTSSGEIRKAIKFRKITVNPVN